MNDLPTSLFDYELPAEAIAQTPAERRSDSRLLVVDRLTQRIDHRRFADFADLVPPATRLFRNNVAVLKARLRGRRPSGGTVECLLLHPAANDREWWCLLRPGRRLAANSIVQFPGAEAVVQEKNSGGQYRLSFTLPDGERMAEWTGRHGETPLPPYIRRTPGDPRLVMDAQRYQTVYADPGKTLAVAAPTAGLHFSEEIISQLLSRGCRFCDVTLQVGLGTFKPIESATLKGHTMHREWYEIPPATQVAWAATPPDQRWTIGTTTLRALEDYDRKRASSEDSAETSFYAEAGLFLYPPVQFQTGALLTNFHLPRSTLLCLVSAFLTPGKLEGIAWLKEIYTEAIALGYRFYSYGDAMLIR